MRGFISACEHVEPGITIVNQATLKGFLDGISGSGEVGVALVLQVVFQGVPRELISILKRLDKALSFQLREVSFFDEFIETS